ncbi:MAG: signal peptide peptidase SppA [Halanaeroarchaeum sp.]
MASSGTRLDRLAVVGVLTLLGVLLGAWAFLWVPGGDLARLLGVLATVGVAVLAFRVASGWAREVFPDYNVARVTVEGPIERRPSQSMPPRPQSVGADDLVDRIEAADDDTAVDGLLVELDTPGGEVVPSEDLRRAVADFDGPTIGYARDTCASGGYWIASGCDRVVAREGSLVGSIGVLASRMTGADLLDRLGITYERLVAGDYKDAGVALKEMEADEREYLQGIVDGYYDTFLDRVAEGRDVDREALRETEARVYLGPEAKRLGLVDEVGDRDAALEWLEESIGAPATVRDFEPDRGLVERLQGGASAVAYSVGAGAASVVFGEDGPDRLEFR